MSSQNLEGFFSRQGFSISRPTPNIFRSEERQSRGGHSSVESQPFDAEGYPERYYFINGAAAAIGSAVTEERLRAWAKKKVTSFGMSMVTTVIDGHTAFPETLVLKMKELLPTSEALDELVTQHRIALYGPRPVPKARPIVNPNDNDHKELCFSKHVVEIIGGAVTEDIVRRWMKQGETSFGVKIKVYGSGNYLTLSKATALELKQLLPNSKALFELNRKHVAYLERRARRAASMQKRLMRQHTISSNP